MFDVAPGTQGPAWAPGAEIRGVLGSGLWSLVGAAGARGPATLSFEGGWKAELLRFPLDVGARMTAYWGRLRPWLVLGGSATPTAILGQDLVQTDRQWRLELGALAMVGATLRVVGASAWRRRSLSAGNRAPTSSRWFRRVRSGRRRPGGSACRSTTRSTAKRAARETQGARDPEKTGHRYRRGRGARVGRSPLRRECPAGCRSEV